MPRLFSRLPASLHTRATKWLLWLSAICSLVAVLLLIQFSQKTETSGHLWWKKTHEIPFSERRPYLVFGIGLFIVAAICVGGAVELFSVRARSIEATAPTGPPSNNSFPFLLVRAIRRGRQERRAREAAELEATAKRLAEARATDARRRYEQSTRGKAETAFNRGDEYFSIELEVDRDLAWHLNQIRETGWRQQSVHYSYRKTTHAEHAYGITEVTRETKKYATYLFNRGS